MTAANAAEDETSDAKAVYEAVVGRVRHNTGGQNAPLATEPSITAGVCRSGYAPSQVTRAIGHACKRGDLFRWRDPVDGRMYLGLDDVDELRVQVASYVERVDDPDKRRIAVANQRIDHLRGEDGE